MNSFQLAMRVLRVDRRTRTSAILTAVGVAVATSLVLLLASLPGATQARSQRAIWQDIHSYYSDSGEAQRPAPLLMAANKDYAGDREITRVDVALTGTSPMLSLPPGIPKLPGPGEAIVSPALGKLIQSTPSAQLGERFGKLVNALGPDSLMYPEQLVAVVGHTPDAMPKSAQAADGFPNKQAEPDPLLELLAWVGVIVLLVPSLVLVASSARLTAARREVRMAALRLAGATPGQVMKIVAGETALSAIVGALLGILVAPALQGLATFVPWGGGTWLASDFGLSTGSTVAVAVAIPLLVVFAGVLGIRRVLKTPLFAASAHARKPLHWWRLLSVPVAGAFFLFAVSQDQASLPMVMFGLFLLVGSAAIIGPWVTSAVGGTFVRVWRKPASLLAGRRLRDDPKSAYRATAGVVLAVFTGSMALTLLPSFESMAGGGRTFKDNIIYADADAAHAQQMVDQTNASLARNGIADKAVAVGQVYLATGEAGTRSETLNRAFVMTCEDAESLLRVNIGGSCRPGPAVYSTSPLDLSKYRVSQQWNQAGVPLGNVPVRVFSGAEEDTFRTIVIDPALLPAGVTPENLDVVVPTTPSNGEVVRTALVGAAPGVEVGSRGLHLIGQQQELADLRRVTVIGLIAAGVLAGCSAAVATAGSVMDRRRTFGALIAAGTPVRVLARALRMEAALPAMVATIGAGVVGIGVGVGLYSMVEKDPVVLSPWLLAPVVLGIGVALLGASVSTPALKRVQSEPLADE
ncbi:FtsX-like permease family protein [Amycolatopsis regifaucium]|uniref:Permease n=1 Tax=Amycolatopsis regifaucium TaxID=546365 RepID=A0A154MNI6_9PSEU|nr:ABC transporter permease [Amycolatopsis regifaucium]KZB84979.1 permease [Amycolatopsis regifaucium]OKA03997.1 permease [Amycolatopsis regifaucium]SFH98413.1 FtsX-like permease family protein [Amycolatopsis regifaucium]